MTEAGPPASVAASTDAWALAAGRSGTAGVSTGAAGVNPAGSVSRDIVGEMASGVGGKPGAAEGKVAAGATESSRDGAVGLAEDAAESAARLTRVASRRASGSPRALRVRFGVGACDEAPGAGMAVGVAVESGTFGVVSVVTDGGSDGASAPRATGSGSPAGEGPAFETADAAGPDGPKAGDSTDLAMLDAVATDGCPSACSAALAASGRSDWAGVSPEGVAGTGWASSVVRRTESLPDVAGASGSGASCRAAGSGAGADVSAAWTWRWTGPEFAGFDGFALTSAGPGAAWGGRIVSLGGGALVPAGAGSRAASGAIARWTTVSLAAAAGAATDGSARVSSGGLDASGAGGVTSTGCIARGDVSPGSLVLVAGGTSATALSRATVGAAGALPAGVGGTADPPAGEVGRGAGRAGVPPVPSSGSSLAA